MLKIKGIGKNKQQKGTKRTAKLLPFQERLNQIKNIEMLSYYDEDFTVVNTVHDSYVLLRIVAPALRPMSADNIEYMIEQLAQSYVTLEHEIRYITNNDYINLSKQKKFWQKKKEATKDKGKLAYNEEKLGQFKTHEKNVKREAYYVKVAGKDKKEAIKNAYNFMQHFRVYVVIPLYMNEVKRILRFEHNPNERVKRDEEIF